MLANRALSTISAAYAEEGIRTRYNIARIHGVFVLNKAEAIHELDLGNLTGAMGVEVVLNIGLGSYNHTVQSAMPCQQVSKKR